MMEDTNNSAYVNSTDYATLLPRIKKLQEQLDDLVVKSIASRKLRYSEVDIEAERNEGRLQPDELFTPVHIIDTNIRREQAPYIQFVAQSQRAVVCRNKADATTDMSLLERDLTDKIRYDGWQLPIFASIDGMQANGYSIAELVQDLTKPGELSLDNVQYGDFAFISDTRDLQAAEMVCRSVYFTKTRLLSMKGDGVTNFNAEEVIRLTDQEPRYNVNNSEQYDFRDKSLYQVFKLMFRVKGIVHVAWASPDVCSTWLRDPRPLFIGRRKVQPPNMLKQFAMKLSPNVLPDSMEAFETEYPYFVFPYLISENDTISQLKGRVYLDQDTQEAVTSLLSSTVTQARRSAGLYGSKDVSDPNDDLLLQKNIYLRSGCIINSKIQFTQLAAPDPAMFQAIQLLVTGNQQETSQVNFAVNNRKDSRKTAKEVGTAEQQAAILSTVQVVLFSIALSSIYRAFSSIVKTRVQAGLIKVNPTIRPFYDLDYAVKPSGDSDVIEKQQLIQTMMQSWPVIQNTPAGPAFLSDLIELMFPANAAKYMKAFVQAQQQASSQQAQQMQQGFALLQQLGKGIVDLSKHPQFFSEQGRIHVLPIVEHAAEQLEAFEAQARQAQPQKQPTPQAQ